MSRAIVTPLRELLRLTETKADLATKSAALEEAGRTGDDAAIRVAGYVSNRAAGCAARRSQLHPRHVRAYDGRRTAPTEIQGIAVGPPARVAVRAEPFAQAGATACENLPALRICTGHWALGAVGHVWEARLGYTGRAWAGARQPAPLACV